MNTKPTSAERDARRPLQRLVRQFWLGHRRSAIPRLKMGDLLHPPRAISLGDMEPKGHPTLQRLARTVLRILDWHVCMTAPVLPFVPPSTIRRKLAWTWVRLMAKLRLMPQPFACVVTRRESDLIDSDSLRPAVSGYSFFRLVSPCGVLIGDVCELPNNRPEWRGAKGVEMQTGRAIPRPLQADS